MINSNSPLLLFSTSTSTIFSLLLFSSFLSSFLPFYFQTLIERRPYHTCLPIPGRNFGEKAVMPLSSTSHLARVTRAVCRQVPRSVLNGLSGNKVAEANAPDYQKAVDQHAAYMEHLVEAIGLGEQGVYVCDADENHPDCVFVEDTAVVSSPTSAVSTSIGVESRRGEEKVVLDALLECGVSDVLNMRSVSGAHLDGGDVLFTGRHVFVGLSSRTNMLGCEVLRKSFPPGVPIVPVQVVDNLHFKCSITAVDENNLVVANTDVGRSLVRNALGALGDGDAEYTVHFVENDIAANILRCNHVLIVPEGVRKESRQVYDKIAKNVPGIDELSYVDNSEFVKIDGSLTCRSVLLWDDSNEDKE